MKFDPKIYHRHSIRLRGYDYSRAGAYFVTVVAWQREMLFGEIVNGEMKLNQFGELVRDERGQTAVVRPNVELGEYVVMPNHFHGILVFINDDAYTVGATRRVAPTKTLQSGSLGAVMAQFKSVVTKRINGLRNVAGLPIWHEIIMNTSSVTNAKWTGSPAISNPIQPGGRRMMKIRIMFIRRRRSRPSSFLSYASPLFEEK